MEKYISESQNINVCNSPSCETLRVFPNIISQHIKIPFAWIPSNFIKVFLIYDNKFLSATETESSGS